MEQNESEKKMPSMHANAIRRSAKDLELLVSVKSSETGDTRVSHRV